MKESVGNHGLWTVLPCILIVLNSCLLSTDASNPSNDAKPRWRTLLIKPQNKRSQGTSSFVTPSSNEKLRRPANNWKGLDLWRRRRQGMFAINQPYVNTYGKPSTQPVNYWNNNNWSNKGYNNAWYLNQRSRAPLSAPNVALGNSVLGNTASTNVAQFAAKARSNVDLDKKFVEEKIQEYYEERLNKNKNHWMYKLVNGTSPHIKDIFIGRCWDFTANKAKFLKNPSSLNCSALWEKFEKSFAFKGPCDVTHDDYTPFFEMFAEKPLYNRVLLWSGTRELTHTYSGLYGTFTTLEDTLAGYLLNGLRWCGSKKEPGINFTACPYECSKQKPFFGQAAERLAKRAKGVVHVMLNGTRQHFGDKQIFPTFMDDSYLGQNQLTSLPVPSITEFRILVGHSLHQKSFERCGSLTVLELENRARGRGLKTTCYDNPYFIRHLLCLGSPGDPLCMFKIADQESML